MSEQWHVFGARSTCKGAAQGREEYAGAVCEFHCFNPPAPSPGA